MRVPADALEALFGMPSGVRVVAVRESGFGVQLLLEGERFEVTPPDSEPRAVVGMWSRKQVLADDGLVYSRLEWDLP
jgi:hypothetical protein